MGNRKENPSSAPPKEDSPMAWDVNNFKEAYPQGQVVSLKDYEELEEKLRLSEQEKKWNLITQRSLWNSLFSLLEVCPDLVDKIHELQNTEEISQDGVNALRKWVEATSGNHEDMDAYYEGKISQLIDIMNIVIEQNWSHNIMTTIIAKDCPECIEGLRKKLKSEIDKREDKPPYVSRETLV